MYLIRFVLGLGLVSVLASGAPTHGMSLLPRQPLSSQGFKAVSKRENDCPYSDPNERYTVQMSHQHLLSVSTDTIVSHVRLTQPLHQLGFLSHGKNGCVYDVIKSLSLAPGVRPIPLPAVAKTALPYNPLSDNFFNMELTALEEVSLH